MWGYIHKSHDVVRINFFLLSLIVILWNLDNSLISWTEFYHPREIRLLQLHCILITHTIEKKFARYVSSHHK